MNEADKTEQENGAKTEQAYRRITPDDITAARRSTPMAAEGKARRCDVYLDDYHERILNRLMEETHLDETDALDYALEEYVINQSRSGAFEGRVYCPLSWRRGTRRHTISLDDFHGKILKQIRMESGLYLAQTHAFWTVLEKYAEDQHIRREKENPGVPGSRPVDVIRYFRVGTAFRHEPLYFISDHTPTLPEVVKFFAEDVEIHMKAGNAWIYIKNGTALPPGIEEYGDIEEIMPEDIMGSPELETREWYNLAKDTQLYYYYAVLESDDPSCDEPHLKLLFCSMYEDPQLIFIEVPFWNYIFGEIPGLNGCSYCLRDVWPAGDDSYEKHKSYSLPMAFKFPVPDEAG